MIAQFLTCIVFLSILPVSLGQIFDERFEDWPVDLKINGKVIVAEELDDLSILGDFLREERSQSASLIMGSDVKAAGVMQLKNLLNEEKTSLQKIDKLNVPGLKKALVEHEVVVINRKQPFTEDERASIIKIKKDFTQFIERGGTFIGLGEASKLVAAFFVENETNLTSQGLNLIPDVIIDSSYNDQQERKHLLKALSGQPRCVGLGLAPNTALMLSGRKIRVIGSQTATVLLVSNDREPVRVQTLTRITGNRRNVESFLLDLTQWRRDAIDRTLPAFPAASPRLPHVENGTLIIVGGGGNPAGLTRRMIDLAGGVDNARLVYIPCSEADSVSERQRTVELWKRMGVKHATFIHTKDRNKSNTDEAFLEPLKNATGIYFGGGRQWNFSDSYYGTKAHQLMKDVLKRGGVIAGSSAGASIQGRYLARATPISNVKIMAFGYERGGLGFLDGVAIDQHFSERRRQKDMTQLVTKHPQLLGIGLDESTAIIVQKSRAEVVGKGRVFFYDRQNAPEPEQPDYIALPAGSEFDLAKRKVLKNGSK